MTKVRCPKCGERNDIDNKECFYCENKLVDSSKTKKDKQTSFIGYVRNRKYMFSTIILLIALLSFGGTFAFQKYQEANPNKRVSEARLNEQAIVSLFNIERVKNNSKSVHLTSDLSLLALRTLEKAVQDRISTKPALEYVKTTTTSSGYTKFISSVVLSNISANDIIKKLVTSEGFLNNEYESVGVAIDGQGRVVVVLGQANVSQTVTAPTPTTTTTPTTKSNSYTPYVSKPYVAGTCTTTTIPYKTKTIYDPTLREGQTQTTGGYNGTINSCTPDSTGYVLKEQTIPATDMVITIGTKRQNHNACVAGYMAQYPADQQNNGILYANAQAWCYANGDPY